MVGFCSVKDAVKKMEEEENRPQVENTCQTHVGSRASIQNNQNSKQENKQSGQMI